MKFVKWGNHQDEQGIEYLETLLAAEMVPVAPRPHYIKELKRRLAAYPTPAPVILKITPRAKEQKNLLWALAGLVSGAFLLLVGLRGLAGLLKRKAVNQFDKVKTKPVAANPAVN